MPGSFFDTNVLLYVASGDPAKADRAGHDIFIELAGEDFEKSVTAAAVEHAFKAHAESKLAKVDWTRGSHWLSVGA
jgi:hypothetical protein